MRSVAPISQLWTIGHSNHSPEDFVALLRGCSIEVVADVRSVPYSRYTPHFSQAALRSLLARAGLEYVFLGRELGGRPPERDLYDDDGHVLYGRLARTPRFGSGLDRLREFACPQRVTMMCSEEDPTECHRRLLVARALLERDPTATVIHIRGDGSIIDEAQLASAADGNRQLGLFVQEEQPWKSARSVSRSTLLRASSAS